MADEAAVSVETTATLTPLFKIRYNGIHQLTSAEIIQKINECVSHDKQIDLFLVFSGGGDDDDDDENYQLFRFDATGAMQNTIVENSRYIKKIAIYNYCKEKGEHRRCFNFFTRIVLGIIGNGKHLAYETCYIDFELEQANQLARALLQLNNNNNGAVEFFSFYYRKLNSVTFQPLWDALLESGVRKIKFGNDDHGDPPINNNNNGINFTGMETNESLKELDLSEFYMRNENCRNLFHSIKKNKGIEKLQLSYWKYRDLSKEMKKLFEEMMCENITLLDCIVDTYGDDVQDGIFELIQFHMKVNQMWKRYMMQREREKKTRTVITRIEEGDNNNNNNNEEEGRKKRLKMRLLLHLFMKKPVMRDTIIFHLLREYPDDFVRNTKNTNNEYPQQNPLFLHISCSNFAAKNKRKRTTDDDGDNDSNDGTDDPDDNDNDSDSDDSDVSNGGNDSGDSESDDCTDGTL